MKQAIKIMIANMILSVIRVSFFVALEFFNKNDSMAINFIESNVINMLKGAYIPPSPPDKEE